MMDWPFFESVINCLLDELITIIPQALQHNREPGESLRGADQADRRTESDHRDRAPQEGAISAGEQTADRGQWRDTERTCPVAIGGRKE